MGVHVAPYNMGDVDSATIITIHVLDQNTWLLVGVHTVRFGFVAKPPTEPNGSVLLSDHLQLNRWFFGSVNCRFGSVGLVDLKHK